LKTDSLYLSRLDQFEDNLEGISPFDINELRIRLKLIYKTKNPNQRIPVHQWDKLIASSKEALNQIKSKLEIIQRKIFVNCWFLGNVESFGMWDLYAPSGFVIRFDRVYFQNLIKKRIIHQSNADLEFESLIVGKIEYQNFDNMLYKEKESLLKYRGFRKHLTFQHEEEYRVVGFLSRPSEKKGIEFNIGSVDDTDFEIFANPRINSNTFKTYSDILQHYTQKHILMESKLKTWIEFRNSNFD